MHVPQFTAAKVIRKARHLGRQLSYALGAGRSFYRKAGGSRILIYHGISETDHTRFNPIFLTRKQFEAQLRLYRKYCHVVSLEDYYAGRLSNTRFNICLTFDDGFANNHRYVLPLLDQYQMPAAFFITAIREAGYDVLWNDFLGIISKYGPAVLTYKNRQYRRDRYGNYCSTLSGERFSSLLRAEGFDAKAEMMELLYPLVPFKNNQQDEDYWLQLSLQQIREMAASPLVTIGAHGYYHNDLAAISLSDASLEMAQTKQFLEKITGRAVTSLAFPYGSYTRELVQEAKNIGYSQLLAMDFCFAADEHDPALRERFTVNPFISPLNQLHATLTRSYE